MDWTTVIQDAGELRAAFSGYPDARYRPITAWWLSGETLTDERVRWQLDQIITLGCGGLDITGLALHGPSAGSVADDPPGMSEEWIRFARMIFRGAEEAGLGVASWSPFQLGKPVDVPRLLREHPEYRGQMITGGEAMPFGYDYGNPEAVDALAGPGTLTKEFLDAFGDMFGGAICAMFEDEFPAFPRWSPTFAKEFREAKGYDVPPDVFERDHGPRTPAMRFDVFDVATARIERGYTRWQTEWVAQHGMLAGYDQNNRRGTPVMSSAYYLDPFRTMSWANAPGTDQMGDARFHLSLADLSGAPRVWLEGFHSHGWGFRLDDQMRLLFEWGREGCNLFLPHGMYYSGKALWWEWAPPEMGWKQPYARHYPAFAAAVGRLMMALSAGRHVPEIAVLYPLTTVWAGTDGHLSWSPEALEAERAYIALFGVHGVPSGQDLERSAHPSLLAEAGYDRIAVDEANVDTFDIPILVPAARCLRTKTVERLIAGAERGRTVILVKPLPEWSAEQGREDATFQRLVARLAEVATVVATPEDAVAALPPPRVEGLKAQWRRVNDLDFVLITGTGQARLRGIAGRAPERWDIRTGAMTLQPATVDDDDLLIDCEGPELLFTLPVGTPIAPVETAVEIIELPEVWDAQYLEWGENRWGDYRLPGNPGTPPVERRTFAWREGDDPSWRNAPVTPEDVQHPLVDLSFDERMAGKNGRPAPADRLLGDGWREVVSTYGPKAVLYNQGDDSRLVEYSERLGVEDLLLSTPIGLKGFVEPWKVDLGPGGRGRLRAYALIPEDCTTHLVIEGWAVLTVRVDGAPMIGPVEGGLLVIPVELTAGWHEIEIEAEPRTLAAPHYAGYRPPPRTLLSWAFMEPYTRDPVGIWGGPVMHPDYKGSPGPRQFRRRVVVGETARCQVVRLAGSGAVEVDLPETLEPGEHIVTATMRDPGPGPHSFVCAFELAMPSGTVTIGTDDRWETAALGSDGWQQVFAIGAAGAISWSGPAEGEAPRRNPLLDVAWLEGEDTLLGHAEILWADAPDAPPPSWFCFTAPPGAQAIQLPIEGTVEAWLDGEPTALDGERLPLRPGARVALRVQPTPGHRGAACFREHPLLELSDGEIRTGLSWHRQGLDVFSGVILHRARVVVDGGGPAELDLGEVSGTVGVRVNGEEAGVLFCSPWRLPVELADGENTIELEVTNTLGPLASRGIPTPFGPEDQRFSGILARPRLLKPRS